MIVGGAENTDGVPWGAWQWTTERLVSVLLVVALCSDAHGTRDALGLATLARVLLEHGPATAARLLGAMSPASCGGWAAWHCARVVLRAAGVLDLRAARRGRVRVASRESVIASAWLALRAAGVSADVARRELGAVVGAWDSRGAAWVVGVTEGWR